MQTAASLSASHVWASSIRAAHVRSACLSSACVSSARLCPAGVSSSRVSSADVRPYAVCGNGRWAVRRSQKLPDRDRRIFCRPIPLCGQLPLLGAEMLSAGMPACGLSPVAFMGFGDDVPQSAETNETQVIGLLSSEGWRLLVAQLGVPFIVDQQ